MPSNAFPAVSFGDVMTHMISGSATSVIRTPSNKAATAFTVIGDRVEVRQLALSAATGGEFRVKSTKTLSLAAVARDGILKGQNVTVYSNGTPHSMPALIYAVMDDMGTDLSGLMAASGRTPDDIRVLLRSLPVDAADAGTSIARAVADFHAQMGTSSKGGLNRFLSDIGLKSSMIGGAPTVELDGTRIQQPIIQVIPVDVLEGIVQGVKAGEVSTTLTSMAEMFQSYPTARLAVALPGTDRRAKKRFAELAHALRAKGLGMTAVEAHYGAVRVEDGRTIIDITPTSAWRNALVRVIAGKGTVLGARLTALSAVLIPLSADLSKALKQAFDSILAVAKSA
jgi:hypothetical protein